MSEQIKTTTVDQLPEATSLDGLYVFGYASKNAVGKRSVKTPIALLKGNKGDTGAAGKDGNDGEVTTAQLEASLRDSKFLASAEANGLLSKELYTEILEMRENMLGLQNKFNTHVVMGFDNSTFGERVNLVETEYPRGDLAYAVQNSEITRQGTMPANERLVVPHNFTRIGDVVTFYVNNLNKIYLKNNTSNSFVYIKTTAGSLTRALDFNGSTYKYIDLSEFVTLTELYGANNQNLKSLNLSYNSKLSVASLNGSKELTSLSLYGGAELKSISVTDSSKLASITIINGNTTSLTAIYLPNTAITKAGLLAIEAKWASRSGKDTGVLRLSKTLYDTLTSEERKLFTDKNITFDIVGQ